MGTVPSRSPPFTPTLSPIPLELLRRPDPILFFDEVMLYEDEMADNGITMLSCKIRVMPARLLLLSRFFMRLDNVLFRIRDTRVYVDFSTGEVIREYVAKEDRYETIRMVSTLRSIREGCKALTVWTETCRESRRYHGPNEGCEPSLRTLACCEHVPRGSITEKMIASTRA